MRDPDATIDWLWERLWAGGVANPLTAIEQISYLIFLRHLDGTARDEIFEGYENLRWGALRNLNPEDQLWFLKKELIPFLQRVGEGDAFSEAMADAAFTISKPSLVRDCISAIDQLELGSQDRDYQGDIYEKLLKQLQLSGRNGQFRTPRHIIKAIVELVDPKPGDVVCDPAAGTAGFLVAARDHIAGKPGEPPSDDQFLAYDFDASMVRLGVMNLILHGVSHPAMHYGDALSESFPMPAVDVVLANPPFTGSVDRHDVNPALGLDTTRTELLFMELCRRLLKPRGTAAIIVPEGALFGSSRAHVEVRRRWLAGTDVQAVVSLPAGVFRPYTNVKTAILLAKAGRPTDRVWFCPVESDGYSLDDRRAPRPKDDDLKHMAKAVRAVVAGRQPRAKAAKALADRMWSVSVEDIVARGCSLSPSAYLQADPLATVEQDPIGLLEEVDRLESEIRRELDAVGAFLRDSP